MIIILILKCCVLGETQADTDAFCYEEDEQAAYVAQKSGIVVITAFILFEGCQCCSLFYLSLHTLIGQFCGPLSPVRQRDVQQAIFEISNIQLDSEAVRTKTIETRWNECEKYLHIIHFPLPLSSEPLFQAEL